METSKSEQCGMDKERLSRKKSIDVKNLPASPDVPIDKVPSVHQRRPNIKLENDPFAVLFGFKEREMAYMKSLNDSVKAYDSDSNLGDANNNKNGQMSGETTKNCEDECREFIVPLINRTQGSVTALLATRDSLDQLDNLHRIVKQLLSVQEQNYQMRKRLKIVETLHALKSMEIQMNAEPDKFIRSSMDDGSDLDIDAEFEQNMADLETILAASRSASSKRNISKKHRSKSIISDEMASGSKDNDRNYPLRRQSAISDFKPKVSKWTKVKAAFRWEKTHTLPLNESKSSDSVLSPNNGELARYLRVPTGPCHGCSSGDSIFSNASSRILTTTSATPPDNSSASSADENEPEKSFEKVNRASTYHDEERRSHSLDGEIVLGPNFMQQIEKGKNKSAWSKVKGIVTHRHSRKSVKSTGSNNSRDVSPTEIDLQRDRTDSLSSSNQPSPSHIGVFNLNIPDNDYGASSSGCYSQNQASSDDNESQGKMSRQGKKGSRKSKHVPEIESLPEGMEAKLVKKPPPSPLNLQKDFSESDGFENSPNSLNMKSTFRKCASSMPNSPSKAMEFFSENDFSSGGDYSEPLMAFRRENSNKSSKSSRQKDEILRNYQELQRKINKEFACKQSEWEKIRPLVVQMNASVPAYLKEDPGTPKAILSNMTLNEENLSADFKKKLDEWRIKKSQQSIKDTGKKHQQQQQLDWQLWKTGQMKLENQGLISLPDAKDLPEDFQKKLNEWKQMKTEGRVPSYSHQSSVHEKMKRQFSKSDSKSPTTNSSVKKSRPTDEVHNKAEGFSKLKALVTEPLNKEIVVQTSKGTMTFKGISRKFTRKLYEWEKAKGIEPESSTFALLHPEYKAIFENKETQSGKREKSPALKRCLSVDSIKPNLNQSDVQISHQLSSLSLNDAESFKETDGNEKKRVISKLKLHCYQKEGTETENDEPEAVIVEVEDEAFETATPCIMTTPIKQMQIPVFKFDLAKRETRYEISDALDAIKEIIDVFENANNTILDIYKTKEVSITSIKHLTNIFKFINHSLGQLKESLRENFNDCNKPIVDQSLNLSNEIAEAFIKVDESFSEFSLLKKLPEINRQTVLLKDHLCNIEKFFDKTNSFQGHQATRTIQNSEDEFKGIATVEVTPIFVCNSVNANDIQTQPTHHTVPNISSDSEIPFTNMRDNSTHEKATKKVNRTTSNGSKRKVRLRRMGSRQSSKTESDSETEHASNANDIPRKVKRKTSRAKKHLESDKSIDNFQPDDEVVYVFKIKPGEKNEISMKPNEIITQTNTSDSVLISPTEICVQPIDASSNDGISYNHIYADAIIKTKRKLFKPIEIEDNCVINATISQEIESSSASDKNDTDKIIEVIPLNTQIECEKKVLKLPPLPSPKVQRKTELVKQGSSKELSPAIKLMIERYNYNAENKPNSPNSSGSCSPIWRSPILDRRVRKQSEEYQTKILKSSSFTEIQQNEKSKPTDQYHDDDSSAHFTDHNLGENAAKTNSSTDTIVADTTAPTDESKGAIPKQTRFKSSVLIPMEFPIEPMEEIVHMRSELNKPRTPLSERALRIKQAKEAFLKMPIVSHDSGQSDWTYRLSQISVGSNDSSTFDNGSLIKCMSAGVLDDESLKVDETNHMKSLSSSLPRNATGLNKLDPEILGESPKSSKKFGLSSIATKFRKVKLKRNAKEVSKMNAVPILCRQSLAVDFTAPNNEDLRESSGIVPKSNSALGIGLSRFRRNDKSEKIKKSKSLGILEQN